MTDKQINFLLLILNISNLLNNYAIYFIINLYNTTYQISMDIYFIRII